MMRWNSQHTFLFQIHATFRDDYRHIAVDVALALVVEQADGDVRVSYTLLKWYAKNALRQDYMARQLSGRGQYDSGYAAVASM